MATNLAAKQTDLAGFFRGLESFAAAAEPVAQTQADLYVNLDTTFRALAPVAVPFLQNWISETPPTFQTVISDSPTLQAFLLNTAGLFSELRPGFATLNQSAPVLGRRIRGGHEEPAGHEGTRRPTAQPVQEPRELGHDARGHGGDRPRDGDRQEPARRRSRS